VIGRARPVTTARLLICLLFALRGPSARSAAPTLEFFQPPGVAVGSTNTVRVTGKFDPWPPKVWTDATGVSFLAHTNQGEFEVVVKPDAPPGARLVRLFNQEGASEPRPFVIGAGPEILELEPNDHFAHAQRIEKLPVTVNGRLDKAGDVDSFSIELKGGQTLEASVDSIVLMSRLDAVLRVVTTNGLQLAWNHDFATLDPRVTWRATNAQTVVAQVFGFPYPATSDVKLTGGNGAFYRLHLGLAGPPETSMNGVDMTASPPPLVELPFATEDCIRTPGELHRVKLHVTEPGWIAAEVRAEAIGSPLDAWLRLDDGQGKQISRNDDYNGSRDPYLEWQAATNTDYTIVVGSLTHQAGDDQRFALSIHRVKPDFTAVATASSLTLRPGTTNELNVTLTRLRGFTNAVQLSVKQLPPGVLCDPATVTAKGADAKLLFVAQTNAAPYQGPFQITAHDADSGQDRLVPFLLTGGTVDNGVPGGYRVLLADRTDSLWATVLAVESPKSAANVAKPAK